MDSVSAYWQFIHEQLIRQTPVMLLYVVSSQGSSPGRQGFCMSVNTAGEMMGSIGGGIMEHKFTAMAKEVLQTKKEYLSLHKQVHNKEAPKNQSGMICSGEQTILLYMIQQEDASTVAAMIDCLAQHDTGCLMFSDKGMAFSPQPPANRYSFDNVAGKEWKYEEQVGYKNHLYIVGAGHCGLALARLMLAMDFYIHLYDEIDRQQHQQGDTPVHEMLVLPDYQEIAKHVQPGANSYVVVMTAGYRTDDIVLRALMQKRFKYIGVLGSAKKITKLFESYQAEGISPALLQPIEAPIGLPIKSRTPEEIAISIAAQIISVKND